MTSPLSWSLHGNDQLSGVLEKLDRTLGMMSRRLDDATSDAKKMGRALGDAETPAKRLGAQLQRLARTHRARVEVDVDDSALRRLSIRLSELGASVAGAVPKPVVIGVAVGAAALLGGGGGAAAAGLGAAGGGLALGIASAATDPAVAAAWRKVADKGKAVFASLGESFKEPLIQSAGPVADALGRMGDKLKPVLDRLAPSVGPLIQGLTSMVEKALPGFLKLMESSKPLLDKFIEHLPKLGESLGSMFEILSDPKVQEAATTFLNVLLEIAEKALPFVATSIATTALAFQTLFDGVRIGVDMALGALGMLVHGAAKAFGWVPELGPKLQKASAEFDTFANGVRDKLNALNGKTVDVYVAAHLRTDAELQNSGFMHHRAKGGPVVPGQVYMVGEEGPEILYNGVVYPLNGGAGRSPSGVGSAPAGVGGGGEIVIINRIMAPDGRTITESQQRYARQSGIRTVEQLLDMPAA